MIMEKARSEGASLSSGHWGPGRRLRPVLHSRAGQASGTPGPHPGRSPGLVHGLTGRLHGSAGRAIAAGSGWQTRVPTRVIRWCARPFAGLTLVGTLAGRYAIDPVARRRRKGRTRGLVWWGG